VYAPPYRYEPDDTDDDDDVGPVGRGHSTARGDTYPRQAGVTITRYAFDVTLSDASSEIVVRETVDVHFRGVWRDGHRFRPLQRDSGSNAESRGRSLRGRPWRCGSRARRERPR